MSNYKTSSIYKDRLGFYAVGNKIFRNRFDAMLLSNKDNRSITWHFNDNVFSEIDWSKKIETSLTELYRIRAQQLRDNYDYLILNFSGGIDSLTVLHAFIDNNIFLDEIVIQVPKNFKPNYEDHSAKNYWSEIEYQAIPYLKKCENQIHKDTKIRIQDLEKPIIELFDNEYWYENVSPHCNLSIPGFARIIAGYKDPEVLNLAMKGISVGRIYGAEKPKIKIVDNSIFGYFSDMSMYMHNSPGTNEESIALLNHHQYEPFFWTPFLPEIVIKQSQVIADKIKSDVAYRNVFTDTKELFEIEKLISPLIYDKCDQVVWKTEKVTDEIIRSSDEWFWNSVGQKTKDSFLKYMEWYTNQIDATEFKNQKNMNGLKAVISRYYFITNFMG